MALPRSPERTDDQTIMSILRDNSRLSTTSRRKRGPRGRDILAFSPGPHHNVILSPWSLRPGDSTSDL
jgi:hypothetical protein